MLKPDLFFDVTNVKCSSLFLEKENVWEILNYLEEFVNNYDLGKHLSEVPEYAFLINPETIFLGKNVKILPGAVIEGPCIIEDGCYIGSGALIRPFSMLCEKSYVGHASEIKASILLPKSKAPHFNYVGDSILGNHVNLGAGVILANYKLNGKTIRIRIRDKLIETKRKKLGAIVGDNSNLGCNSVSNPGTLIPKNFSCNPLTTLQGVIET